MRTTTLFLSISLLFFIGCSSSKINNTFDFTKDITNNYSVPKINGHESQGLKNTFEGIQTLEILVGLPKVINKINQYEYRSDEEKRFYEEYYNSRYAKLEAILTFNTKKCNENKIKLTATLLDENSKEMILRIKYLSREGKDIVVKTKYIKTNIHKSKIKYQTLFSSDSIKIDAQIVDYNLSGNISLNECKGSFTSKEIII